MTRLGSAAPRAEALDLGGPDGRHAGDEWLATVYRQHSAALQRYVARIVGNPTDAEDVVQQVFAKLAAGVTWRAQGVPFQAWLYRVARNAAIDHRRQRSAHMDEVLDDPAGEDVSRDAMLDLHASLRALPDDERTVVLMRHLVGLNSTEIGRHIDRTPSAVDCLQFRARRRLSRHYDGGSARAA